MRKYALMFFVVYLLSTVALSSALDALHVDAGPGWTIVAVLLASLVAAWRFTREQGRVPTAAEQNAYACWALTGTWAALLSLMVVANALLLSPAESDQVLDTLTQLANSRLALTLFAVGLVAVSALGYASIRWSFAGFARLAFRAQRGAAGAVTGAAPAPQTVPRQPGA